MKIANINQLDYLQQSGRLVCCTLFWSSDVINGVVNDELEVLVQQAVDERAAGDAFSICSEKHTFSLLTCISTPL